MKSKVLPAKLLKLCWKNWNEVCQCKLCQLAASSDETLELMTYTVWLRPYRKRVPLAKVRRHSPQSRFRSHSASKTCHFLIKASAGERVCVWGGVGWRELSWQAGYSCFQGLFYCESLSQLSSLVLEGKLQWSSITSRGWLLCWSLSSGYTYGLYWCTGAGMGVYWQGVVAGESFAPSWWLEISSDTDVWWRFSSMELHSSAKGNIICINSCTCINLELTAVRVGDTPPQVFVLQC